MRSVIVSVVGAVMLWGSSVIAQGTPPQPAPEHKRLEYFVGKWTTTGEMKANPFGPAGRISASDSCQWFEGRFAVVCNSDGKGPAGPMKSLGILSYSPDQKVYTYYGLDNTGMVMMAAARGAFKGDVWTFTDEGTMGGQPYTSRFTLKTGSRSSYSFSWELLGKDRKWMTILEGTSTRSQ